MAPKSLLATAVLLLFFGVSAISQQAALAPVYPCAPGHPTVTIKAATATITARQSSEADVSFMRDTILHYVRTAETDVMHKTRAANPEVIEAPTP